ncbi:tyrosine phosphatase [Nemania sp. FL0916]|nr:tyrosine phosphatase [Nemania sp. FL0916]
MTDKELDAPFVSVTGVLNFRDIGGYPIPSQPGKEVRRGLVYRSSAPSQTIAVGYEKMQQLRIATIYDLRSYTELSTSERASCGGGSMLIKTIPVPIFRDEDYAPEAEAVILRFKTYKDRPEGFAEGYMGVLAAAAHSKNEARPYASILEHLALSDDPQPMLIHCRHGKDRTAIICALILSLCGVEDEVVAYEYSLSDTGLASLHNQLVAKLLLKQAYQEDPKAAKQMVRTRKENMLYFLKKLKEEYGSVEQCVVDLKLLTSEGIGRLRTNMIKPCT